MVGLAALALRPALAGRWRVPGAIGLLSLAALLCAAPPSYSPDLIPTRNVAATPGSPLSVDNGQDIDLILLSGSSHARKQPLDDAARGVSLVQPYRFTLGGDAQPVLAMQPPSAITYTLLLPARAQLRTALALNPQVWQPDKGDGVEFVIRISAGNASRDVFRRYIDPKNHAADRRWHDITVDLSAYGDQQVQLTLLTLPGPAGDGSYDWAGWGQPVIVRKE
jgi:hypothetical protein